MTTEYPIIRLKPRHDKRLRAGHLWVYSNELDLAFNQVSEMAPGQIVRIENAGGRALGLATVNPQSLICARILTRDSRRPLGRSFWRHRMAEARAIRERLGMDRYGRQIFGEADGLPGLVIDRFDDVLVAQSTTAGCDAHSKAIERAITEVFEPRVLIWKNDSSGRDLEHLPREVRCSGELPESLCVVEAGLQFHIQFASSQKTGWFYDQRANRDLFARLAPTGRVLDLFSYRGGWAMRALAAGAETAIAVDSSEAAIKDIGRSAATNNMATRLEAIRADAFKYLEEAAANRERFDVVIVDPPAFAKKRKDVANARRAYRRLNELALRVISPGGLLVSCSCSFHIREDVFNECITEAARHVDRGLRLVARLQQGPDHPVHPAMPETRYLKGLVAVVGKAG